MWVGTYFKEILCGTRISTQRSEIKLCGYCDNLTAIHEFAKPFLEFLAHNKENEAQKEFNFQVKYKNKSK